MEFHDVLLRLAKDHIVQLIALGVLVFSACIVYFSFTLALITVLSFGVGIAGAQFLLNHREQIGDVAGRVKSVYCPEVSTSVSNTCLICDTSDCSGHDESQHDFKEFKVNSALDAAVESFYTRILSSFVQSWFSLLSHDEDFIQLLKTNLREATCRIIDRIQKLDIPAIITYKLLPNFYSHHKMIQEMIERGVPLDKLADSARHNEISIHPAVINRKAELNYLRAISKYLIPRLFKNENFDSNIFFSLIRELIACWVLLPLMDVLSDPNLINLLILLITNKDSKKSYIQTDIQDRVVFLKKFVTRSKLKRKNQIETANIDDILQDPEKLFPFMQFLKKEGAVEILRFYLDVSALNKDLQDPKVTTDPSKLSSLYQQSEKLLNAYNALVTFDNDKKPLDTLDAANEDARIALEELFGKAFQNSAAYFQLIYGSRDIKENPELKNGDLQGSTKISTELREVIRGAVDGMPLEALETPTVWDAFTDIDGVLEKGSLFNPGGGPKMRKDRVQGLEPFVMTFFQSIEQNADLGEDVISISDHSNIRPCPPGRNLVFGDLFEMRKANTNASSINKVDVRGPSQCLLYFLKEIYRAPVIILRFAMTIISVSRSTVDTLISGGIMKLIYLGLYEPRLASLITLLEAHLFNEREPGPSAAELLERQRQAFKRLNAVKQGLGAISTTLQSPALNKHLMYSLFDIVLSELFPDLKLN